MDQKTKESLIEIRDSIKEDFEKVKKESAEEIVIDENLIDDTLMSIPRLHMRYSTRLAEQTNRLKDLYSKKEKFKLERWKYWSGKQSDQYYAKNGIVHEKILKTDVDRYLSADEKLELINEIINQQKAIVEHLERCVKEIQSMGFHCKAIIDWRKFTTGG